MNFKACFNVQLIVAVATITAASAAPVSADIVTVGQLGTTNVTAGGPSGFITVPVFDAGGPAVSLAAWQLGIRIVPLGGATGTVTVILPSLVYPSNYIIPSGDRVPAAAPYIQNGPQAGDLVIGGSSGLFNQNQYQVNGSGQALLDFRVIASSTASGEFDIRLFEQSEHSFWMNGETLSPATSFQNHPFFVNGVPLNLQTAGSMSLGTISVSTVPEPSSLILSGTGVALAAWRARRKKRKQAASTPVTNPGHAAGTVCGCTERPQWRSITSL